MAVWSLFYHHHYLLLLINGYGMSIIIHNGEGVTQGVPLYMVAYRIGFLPLIKCLKLEYPDITQTWYADNAGALGTFNNLERHFN